PYELADQVLGFFSIDEAPGRGALVAPSDISSLVELVLAARQRARARGDFAEADRLRADLGEAGVLVEDTPKGPKWKRKEG
ncbi:MAG: cysteine--tRNA ligase, partial [Euryarchaeota archaeon]|nr:cysteine--tRNA ligase [Euryarchaeota archaeon]